MISSAPSTRFTYPNDVARFIVAAKSCVDWQKIQKFFPGMTDEYFEYCNAIKKHISIVVASKYVKNLADVERFLDAMYNAIAARKDADTVPLLSADDAYYHSGYAIERSQKIHADAARLEAHAISFMF